VNERIRPAIEAKTTTLEKVKEWVKDAGVPMVDFMAEWDKQVADPETERETLAQKAGRLKAEEAAAVGQQPQAYTPAEGEEFITNDGRRAKMINGVPTYID